MDVSEVHKNVVKISNSADEITTALWDAPVPWTSIFSDTAKMQRLACLVFKGDNRSTKQEEEQGM